MRYLRVDNRRPFLIKLWLYSATESPSPSTGSRRLLIPSLHQLTAPVKRMKHNMSLYITAWVYRCLCGALCKLGTALPLSLADSPAAASTFSLADLLGASC